MGALEHSVWIKARPEEVWATYVGLKFDVDTRLQPEANGTFMRLRAETHWPRGLGLIGKLVEHAILGSSEARKELANLKALVEREAGAHGEAAPLMGEKYDGGTRRCASCSPQPPVIVRCRILCASGALRIGSIINQSCPRIPAVSGLPLV